MNRRLQYAGLVALGVLAAVLSVCALPQVRLAGASPAEPPARSPSNSATALPTIPRSTADPSASSATSPDPATPDPGTLTRLGVGGLADAIGGLSAASVLVLGDGSGDAADEWVRVWATTYLAKDRAVSYRSWDASSQRWRTSHRTGGGPTLTVWNGSQSAPDLAAEPARVARLWRHVDTVLLSYGHRKDAASIPARLAAVRRAVLSKNAGANFVVLIQNPDPAASEATQLKTTRAVREWAKGANLETVDIYSAFQADHRRRGTLVEWDGSPTPAGSRLWAKTLQAAITEAD